MDKPKQSTMKSFSIPLNFDHGFRLIRSPKIKIPQEIEVPVFLIIHELQSRMFLKHLQAVGLDGCYFENFLDRLILASLNMWDGTDATFKIYFDLMEKSSEDITDNDEVIIRKALKIYYALVKERDKNDNVMWEVKYPIKAAIKNRKSKGGYISPSSAKEK